jgi:hypothetical protein
MLAGARSLIDRFHSMIRKKFADGLDPWIADASRSLIASFANGIVRDHTAVRAAIIEPWSNGQTEGQIIKLKLVMRNARPPAGQADRCSMTPNFIESASDPELTPLVGDVWFVLDDRPALVWGDDCQA